MRSRLWMFGVLLMTVTVSSPALAQHVAGPAAIAHALHSSEAADVENRAIVLKAFEREDVRMMADRLGVDIKHASSAVQSLSGAELAELADPARSLVLAQAGGQTTVVISVTTLLLVLILVAVLAT